MKTEILYGILILGIFQSVFFALLFLSKRGKNVADVLIGSWLIILAVHITLILVHSFYPGIMPDYVPVSFTLLHGPFLYLYVDTLVRGYNQLTRSKYSHMAPFFIAITAITVVPEKHDFIIGIAGLLSGLIYCLLTVNVLKKHRRIIKDTFSYSEKVNLKWLRYLVMGILIIWLGAASLMGLYFFCGLSISLTWFFIIVPLFIFVLGFYGIRQRNIFVDTGQMQLGAEFSSYESEPDRKESSYYKSGLSPEKMKLILDQIRKEIQNEKLYLDSSLSLSDLSKHVNIPAHHITQTLNESAGINFYDLINTYRVEEFKRRLHDPANDSYSLLGIAFDSGFNSKSTFNRIFKKHTDMSPLEYKNSIPLK